MVTYFDYSPNKTEKGLWVEVWWGTHVARLNPASWCFSLEPKLVLSTPLPK